MNKYNLYQEEAGDDGAAGGGSGDAGGDGDQAPVNYFDSTPETWRDDLIKKSGFEGDEATARLEQLSRVGDIQTLTKNYFNAQDKIRKGELSNGLPDDPTEDQLNDWRKANGVPLDPTGYELDLGEGLELSDDDKEVFNTVFDSALGGNVTNSTMSEMTKSFLTARKAIDERRQAQDGVDAQQGAEVLKKSWGGDFDTKINMISGLLNNLPEDVRESFKGGRMADGRGLMNSPEIMEFMANIAYKTNPAGAVVPNSNNPMKTINEEIASLEQRMRDDRDGWAKDTAANNRLMELYDAQDQMNKQ